MAMKNTLIVSVFIVAAAMLLVACEYGNSVCSDNAGLCASSPPCLGEWVGTECKIGSIQGICTDTGRSDVPILTPCCSCDNSAAVEIE